MTKEDKKNTHTKRGKKRMGMRPGKRTLTLKKTETKIPKIRFEYGSELPFSPESVAESLSPHFHHQTHAPRANESLTPEQRAEKITAILVGTGKTRIGAAPTPEAQEVLKKRVLESIEGKKPIHAVINWGPLKFSRRLEQSHVDLADFLALESLVRLNGLIKTYHPAGIRFTAYLEDATADWLEPPGPD